MNTDVVIRAVMAAVRERATALIDLGFAAIRLEIADHRKQIDAALAQVDAEHTDAITDLSASLVKQSEKFAADLETVREALRKEFNLSLAVALEPIRQSLTTLQEHSHSHANSLRELRAYDMGQAAQIDDRIARVVADLGRELQENVSARIAALPPAPAGERGPPGPPGTDGRDAIFTQPQPFIAGRSYARDAVVQYRGALWYATRASDQAPDAAMSGWSLIVDAAHPERIEADDHGFLHMRYVYASGQVETFALNFRPIQHVGIYDDARAYEINDCVTAAGSMWLARSACSGARPGSDAGKRVWQLIVKCGAEGPRGSPGPPGDAGPAGVHWRGNYSPEADYDRGDIVTHARAVFIARDPVAMNGKRHAPERGSREWDLLIPGGE